VKIIARGHIAAAALRIKLRISTAGKSKYAPVLGPYHSPKGCIVKCGRPAGGAHCGRDLKCQIMKKINNVVTDKK